MKEKTIDYRFKILYAVGIIMVVCGHCGGGMDLDLAGLFPYSGIHLAIFVFCSGYFYKKESEEQMGKYIWKKIKTLIIPLYIYTVVYGLIVQIAHTQGFTMGLDFTLKNVLLEPLINGHQFSYCLAGWFVAPLFMVEVFNISVRKLFRIIKLNIPEWVYFILAFILGLIGNSYACKGYNTEYGLALVRFLYFVPFYGLGIFYKTTLEKYDRKIKSIWYFAVVIGIKLALLLNFQKNLGYTPSWCNDFKEGPLMPIVIGILGIAIWMRIATILEPLLGRNKYVNLIANNTYSIMMNHFMGFMIVKTIFALICKYTTLFWDFDWISYKTKTFWFYVPYGLQQFKVLYLLAGLLFPIFVQFCINKIKGWLCGLIKNIKNKKDKPVVEDGLSVI